MLLSTLSICVFSSILVGGYIAFKIKTSESCIKNNNNE